MVKLFVERIPIFNKGCRVLCFLIIKRRLCYVFQLNRGGIPEFEEDTGVFKHYTLQYLEVKSELLAESELLKLVKIRVIKLQSLDLIVGDLAESIFSLDEIFPWTSHEDGDMAARSLR